MDAFDLNVEQRVRVDLYADALEDRRGESFLVFALRRREAVLKFDVVGEFLEFDQSFRLVKNASADRLRQKPGQRRIGLEQPAAEGDAIGLIDDAVGIETMEIMEHRLFHKLAVQRRDAIDLVRAKKRQMAHAHVTTVTLVDERDGRKSCRARSRPFLAAGQDAWR